MSESASKPLTDLPQVQPEHFRVPDPARLQHPHSAHLPLAAAAVRPTQGKTLAVMQVCGGSQSFNTVNQVRVLGHCMRMIAIPNQSLVANAFMEFDDHDRMKPSGHHDRLDDVMEDLVKFTRLTRDVSPYLVDRYSERKESADELLRRVTCQGGVTSQAMAHAARHRPTNEP